MDTDLILRDVPKETDREALRDLLVSTGVFYDYEISVALELLDDRLSRGAASDYSFLFAEAGENLLGYACFGPIACTQGSYDLYWIAVHKRRHGRGVGRRILAAVEAATEKRGGRRIYIETSSRPDYAPTRSFYEACGYRLEACLEDFYGPGDSKAIYVKRLAGPGNA